MSENNSNTSQENPLQEAITGAAEGFLPNAAKLEVAEKAVYLDDIRKMALDERDTVARYREKKVFGNDAGPRKSEDDMGNIIITGDIYGQDVSRHVFSEEQTEKQSLAPQPQPQPSPVTQPPSPQKETSPLKTAALLGAMALGGGGLATLPWLFVGDGKPDEVETQDIQNVYDIEKWVPPKIPS